MKTKNDTRGFVRTEWIGVVFILLLTLSFLIRFANIWIKSSLLVTAANIVAASPVALLVAGLAVFLVARSFIDRRIMRGHKSRKEESL